MNAVDITRILRRAAAMLDRIEDTRVTGTGAGTDVSQVVTVNGQPAPGTRPLFDDATRNWARRHAAGLKAASGRAAALTSDDRGAVQQVASFLEFDAAAKVAAAAPAGSPAARWAAAWLQDAVAIRGDLAAVQGALSGRPRAVRRSGVRPASAPLPAAPAGPQTEATAAPGSGSRGLFFAAAAALLAAAAAVAAVLTPRPKTR